jgi:hypothetical protein
MLKDSLECPTQYHVIEFAIMIETFQYLLFGDCPIC